jgi:hypothetical protein
VGPAVRAIAHANRPGRKAPEGREGFPDTEARPIIPAAHRPTGRTCGGTGVAAAAPLPPPRGARRGVATRKQVEAKLRELIRRLDEAGGQAHGQLARALPETRVIQMEVPDLHALFWTELLDGRLGKLRLGARDGWHMRITADSDDLIAMIDGDKNLFTSYLAGHIKVQASLSDLMALRRLM